MREPEIAVVGTKGQVVIPQRIRKELRIDSKTKLAVYVRGDKVVLTKVKFAPIGEELKALFRDIDTRYASKRRPSETEILAEIRSYRREKRTERARDPLDLALSSKITSIAPEKIEKTGIRKQAKTVKTLRESEKGSLPKLEPFVRKKSDRLD